MEVATAAGKCLTKGNIIKQCKLIAVPGLCNTPPHKKGLQEFEKVILS
jgi:hypothetical protein